jgi:hypothetical protein
MHISDTNRADGDWLLLIYVLPAKHAHARVQAWRRLRRLGAVPLKNSAYVLPDSAEAREDFEWIKNDIVGIGGQAMVLIARAPDAATGDEIVRTFQSARAEAFAGLARKGSTLVERSARSPHRRTKQFNLRELKQAARRFRERFEDVVRVDFFGAPGRDRVAELMARIEQSARKETTVKASTPSATINRKDYRGKIWLTRPRPGVDRMSSAWLIRRFIDPEASFAFGDPSSARAPIPRGAILFDTFEADFGHHASHCTFETLCDRFAISDQGARWIGRMVHDLDLKEDTYHEPEAATVGRVVEGLRLMHHDDQTLLGQGMATFEALYQSFAAKTRTSTTARATPRTGSRRKTAPPKRQRSTKR